MTIIKSVSRGNPSNETREPEKTCCPKWLLRFLVVLFFVWWPFWAAFPGRTRNKTAQTRTETSDLDERSSRQSPNQEYVCPEDWKCRSDNLSFHTYMPQCNAGMINVPNEGFMMEKKYYQTYAGEKNLGLAMIKTLQAKNQQELEDGVFLDIGGNTGFYSLLMAHCFGIRGHVFEPQRACFRTMCSALFANTSPKQDPGETLLDLVTLHNNPVSSVPMMLEVPYKDDYCDPGFSRKPDEGSFEIIDTASIQPADVIDPEKTPILFAKVDVEGNEISVLQSLEPFIQSGMLTDIAVEVKVANWKDKNHSAAEFTRLIWDNDFTVVDLLTGKEMMRDIWDRGVNSGQLKGDYFLRREPSRTSKEEDGGGKLLLAK